MIRQNPFEKKYALLAPYITDENVRKNMIDNKDLFRKYDSNEFMIKAFINELDKRFDKETINKFIVDTIFKFPDEVLVSFITAYLNSDEKSKNNPDVVHFYKKVLHYGNDVIKYIEENGIVTNRECKLLPEKILDARFNKMDNDNTFYRGTRLNQFYPSLSVTEKQTLIDFMETSNYKYLNELFSNYFELNNLLGLLKHTGVDTDIINKQNINALSPESIQMITVIIFSMYGDINLKNTVDILKQMIKDQRYDLIHSLLMSNMLIYAHYIDSSKVSKMDESEMFDTINMSRMILEKAS